MKTTNHEWARMFTNEGSEFTVTTHQVLIDTTIKAVDRFDIRGRGRVVLAVVNAPHIPFVGALSRPGAQLLVDGARVERFELPHVSGAADAWGSFGAFEESMPATVREGAHVAVVLPSPE